MRSWSWGSCHDGLNGRVGMPAYMSKQAYVVMWRLGGAGPGVGTPWNDLNGMFPSSGDANGVDPASFAQYTTTADQSIFSSATANAMTPAVEKTVSADSSTGHRTRIYAALNPTIKVDELSIPLNEGKVRTDMGQVGDTPSAPDNSTNLA